MTIPILLRWRDNTGRSALESSTAEFKPRRVFNCTPNEMVHPSPHPPANGR